MNKTLADLNIPVGALFSTLGRTAARGLETVIIGQAMPGWINELVANLKERKRQDLYTLEDEGWYGIRSQRRAQG